VVAELVCLRRWAGSVCGVNGWEYFVAWSCSAPLAGELLNDPDPRGFVQNQGQ
jgi:hypothetical protein